MLAVVDAEVGVPDAEVVALPVPEADFPGTLPGRGSVSGHRPVYEVDLPLPPGRAGLAPKVSLRYTGDAKDGPLGVGWQLETGAAAVYRCPKIVATDGVNEPIRYENTDALCWKGQRLIAVSGDSGIGGTEYRTEIDRFVRIRQLVGNLSSSFAMFRIEHKDGRIETYGGINARFRPDHATTRTLSWHLSRVEDRSGNRIDYSYRDLGESILLSSIAYTGHGSTTGDRTVDFTYEGPRAAR